MSGSSTAPVLTTFSSGDLVISVVGDGDGSGTYTDNQAAPIVLEELTTAGDEVGQMTLPQETTTVGGTIENAISGEYGSSSEGSLELAGNGQSLVIAGYGVNDTTYNEGESNGSNIYGNVALAQSTSLTDQTAYTPVARVIADINADGTVDTSTALFNVFNTNNPRSVATVNGETFYIAGQGVKDDTTQGVFVAEDGASSATSIDDTSDARTAEIYDGKLYVSRDSTQVGGGSIGDYGNTLPAGTTAVQTLPGINETISLTAGQANSVNTADIGSTVYLSPENYFFADATTLYIADGGAPKEGGLGDGGLQKWTLDTTTNSWVLDYTLSDGLNLVQNSNSAGTDGLIGLTGVVNANGTVTFYTTNETIGDLNQTYVYTITDTLSDTTLPTNETFSVIDTAAADTNVRGIALAPSDPTDITIGAGSTTTAGFIVTNGSTLTVQAGGAAAAVVINSGGIAYIAGTDTGSLIEAGGTETVAGTVTGDQIWGIQIISGGTAYAGNETLDYGGTLGLSGGATLGGALTVMGAATLDMMPGATLTALISGFTAGDAIELQGETGATLTSAVTTSTTVETVTSGGIAQNFTFAADYASNPFTLVNNGGGEALTFNATTVAAGSTLSVTSGETQPSLIVANSGTVKVKTGGVLAGAVVSSGGSAIISAGGSETGILVYSGGAELVSGTGASTAGGQIYGAQTVISGGSAASTTIETGGTLFVSGGGTASGANILTGGSVDIHGAGIASNTVIQGGTLNLQTASATVNGGVTFAGPGEIIVTAAENAGDGLLATISGFEAGDIIDVAFVTGGTLTATAAGGNTQIVIAGAGGSETFTLAGTFGSGLLQLANGDELTATAVPTTYVSAGQAAPANYSVASGTALDVLSGGTAAGVTVLSGGFASFDGTDTATTIALGGSATVGGMETGATINAGGFELVLGTASNDLIYGTQLVSAATAVVSGETVYNGGAIDLFLKGGVASDTVINSGGGIFISGNATAEDTTINNGGSIVIESPKAVVTDGLTFTGTGAIIETDVSDAGYGLLAAISGFTIGDTIVMDGIASGGYSYVTGTGLVIGGGAATLDITGSYTTADFSVVTSGSLTTITDVVVNAPTIGPDMSQTIASGETVASPVISGGTLDLADGSLVLGDITFSGTNGELILGADSLANTIDGFTVGDTIELLGVPYEAGDTATVGTAGLLTLVTEGGDYTLSIAGVTVGEDNFSLSSDIVLTETAPCFCAGTRILTARGEVPVEALVIGDEVVTVREGGPVSRKITWIGHRTVETDRHASPKDVWPVGVAAGAFGAGLPVRDLWLSPGHAVLAGQVLTPICNLQNGATIRQERRARVQYWHVELEAHDLLLAEGLPVESYLDDGNRAAFNNGGAFLQLHPDFKAKDWSEACLPLKEHGPEVAQMKDRLLEQAKTLGYGLTDADDLHIMADGKRVEAAWCIGNCLGFILPPGCVEIDLCSKTFVPAQIRGSSQDTRQLGLSISRMQIDRKAIAMECGEIFGKGWYGLETGKSGDSWRWSNGQARLPAGAEIIAIERNRRGYYWAEPATAPAQALPRAG